MTNVEYGDGTVLVDRPLPQVARITFNRPDRRNAMNAALLGGYYDALNELRDDRTCRVIVITGA